MPILYNIYIIIDTKQIKQGYIQQLFHYEINHKSSWFVINFIMKSLFNLFCMSLSGPSG